MNKYIRKVLKRLKCSKEKKQEVRAELEEAFASRMEAGMDLREIIEEFGSPQETAQEFNEDFPKEEKKQYWKEKIRRRLCVFAAGAAVIAVVLYIVLAKTYDIEDSTVFQKEALEQQSELVIGFLEEKDSEHLIECSTEEIHYALKADKLTEIQEKVSADWGTFQEIEDVKFYELRQMGTKRAMAEYEIEYENVTVKYTLIFNTDMKLEGFSIENTETEN